MECSSNEYDTETKKWAKKTNGTKRNQKVNYTNLLLMKWFWNNINLLPKLHNMEKRNENINKFIWSFLIEYSNF